MLLAVFIASVAVIAGFTTQNVSVTYWTESDISPWGVLGMANIAFPIIFGVMLLLWALYHRSSHILLLADSSKERSLCSWGSMAQLNLAVGLGNILNGYFIVYASNPARTPPLVATVLQNTGVLFAVPFSIWLLGDRKKYWSPLALTASTLIVASVIVSVLPTILKGGNSISAKDIGWILIYLGGMLPGALYNTLQQRLLIKAGVLREDATFSEITTATLRMLFYSNACQTLCLVSLFWLDLLPWFGYSGSLTDFWNNTVFSLTCSFAGPSGAVALAGSGLSPSECGSRTPIWAFTFIAGYTTTYIAGALLNRQSSTYNMLLFVLITMTTSAFWLIPGTNPNPENTPIWSVLTSLGLSLVGVLIWKYWESRTPAHEQFSFGQEYQALPSSDANSGLYASLDGASSLGVPKPAPRTANSSSTPGSNAVQIAGSGSASSSWGWGRGHKKRPSKAYGMDAAIYSASGSDEGGYAISLKAAYLSPQSQIN